MKKLMIIILIVAAVFVFVTACGKNVVGVTLDTDRAEEEKKAEEKEEEPVSEPEEAVKPEENEEPAEPDTKPQTASGDVIVEISWDETDVTFFEDSLLMNYSLEDVCQPCVYIEGESVQRQVFIEDKLHTEKLTITDPNEFVNITVQPCQPSNYCPLDTASATITYADGTVKNLAADEMKVRGQTGIWYLDVYTQN